MANPIQFFFDFVDKLRIFGMEYYGKYYSFYPGVVVDNNDPEFRGRIKCEMPTLLGEKGVHAKWIPPFNMSLSGKDTGHLDVPYVGQLVNVGFFYGNKNQPFYIGGTYAKEELPEEFKQNYPLVRGWVLKSKQKFLIDETDGKQKIALINTDGTEIIFNGESGKEQLLIKHKEGSSALFNENGEILIAAKGDKETALLKSGEVVISSSGKISITCDGEAVIDAKGSAQVKAPSITIEATGSLKVAGNGNSELGSGGSSTLVNGNTVILANGALPVAKLTSQSIGTGNAGAPVVSTIIDGSAKVLVP